MEQLSVGIIGLGLIGGSIAKAIRRFHPDTYMIGFDKNKEALALAKEEGVIDESLTTISDRLGKCRFVFLCTPVSYNSAYLKTLAMIRGENTIITDVGSVKSDIHSEAVRLGLSSSFIGGHPMAGSEKSGFQNAQAHLIENAYYILTPAPDVSDTDLKDLSGFIRSLHALPMILEADRHDLITGTISHLPHILAAQLVNFVAANDDDQLHMKQMAAGGFKDITRIASSSPVMWQHICMKNTEHICSVLRRFIDSLSSTLENIENRREDTIYGFFDEARQYRGSLADISAGPIKKQYALYCDIMDETGGIATIATILATHHISLKNIGIIHNREFEEGVLRIEFYDGDSSKNAAALLQKHHYVVYEL